MQPELQHADPHADPHDVIVAQLRDLAPRLAEVNAPAPQQPAAASPQPASEPPRPAAPLNDNTGEFSDQISRRKLARGATGLIVCAGIATAAAWYSYGDEAKRRLSDFMPRFLASTPAPAQSANAAELHGASDPAPSPITDPARTQDTALAVSATEASPPAAEITPAPVAPSPELLQTIDTMTREIAVLKQTVEQLQSGQQQLSRDVAKAAEHEARRKSAAQASKQASPPQPQRAATLAPISRSVQPASSQASPQGQVYPQTAAQRDAYIPPQAAPAQLPPPPGDTTVPRPPMPLR